MSSRWRSAAGVMLAAALATGLAGCSGSTTPSQSGSAAANTSSSAGCADVAALRDSLTALTQVKPLQDGVPALQAAIAKVKTSLDAAQASASTTLQPEVAKVKSAFDALQTAADGVSSDNLQQKAPMIVVALSQLGTAASALATTVTQDCPGS